MADPKKKTGARGSSRGAPSRARTAGGADRAAKGSAAKGKPSKGKDSPDGLDERAAQLAAPLRRVLQRLPETQRRVLELRMGLADGHPQDPADAARTLGMSLGELREIEARAFERIREVIPLQQLQRFLER
jgi:DNA-directed RNA polymerase specialized sigma24 family protein